MGASIIIALIMIVMPQIFDGDGYRKKIINNSQFIPEDLSTNIAPIIINDEIITEEIIEDDSDAIAPYNPEVDNEVVSEDEHNSTIEPIVDELEPPKTSWQVQLASYSNPDNAKNLVERLKGEGVSDILSEKRGNITRVVVYANDLNDAKRLKSMFDAKYEIQSVIIQQRE